MNGALVQVICTCIGNAAVATNSAAAPLITAANEQAEGKNNSNG